MISCGKNFLGPFVAGFGVGVGMAECLVLGVELRAESPVIAFTLLLRALWVPTDFCVTRTLEDRATLGITGEGQGVGWGGAASSHVTGHMTELAGGAVTEGRGR